MLVLKSSRGMGVGDVGIFGVAGVWIEVVNFEVDVVDWRSLMLMPWGVERVVV